MRKYNCLIFSIVIMIMLLVQVNRAFAQHTYTAADFQWSYSSVASTCDNNGRIVYNVVDKITGDTLNFVGGQCLLPDGARIEGASFQYQEVGSSNESFYSSSSSVTTASIAPGLYKVKWSAQLYNAGSNLPVAIGTPDITQVEVENYYSPSVLNLVGQSIAESSEMYGGRPSLPGKSTGRIQFQVTNANFPLHFVINNSRNETVLDQ